MKAGLCIMELKLHRNAEWEKKCDVPKIWIIELNNICKTFK